MELKAMYFTLDAFLAAMLLIGAVTLVAQMQTDTTSTTTMRHTTSDSLAVLSELRVDEVDHPNVTTMIQDGTIDNPNRTVLEQIGHFWAQNKTDNAANLTDIVLKDVLPGRFGASVYIDDTRVYVKNRSQTQNLVRSRTMLTGVQRGKAIRGSTAAAQLQRVRNKRTESYAYLGGFTGQGNITTFVSSVPDDVTSTADVESVVFEGDVHGSFDLHINGGYCDTFTPDSGDTVAERWNATDCADMITTGRNTFRLMFNGGLNESVVSGGFIKISYTTDETRGTEINGSDKHQLPGIDGVINLYDGFYTPGELEEMKVHLHYVVNEDDTLPFFLDIGNTTVYESNETGEITKTLTNSSLNIQLNYSQLSEQTVPIRLGFFQGNTSNQTGNISDVFLLTSRAGTMNESDIASTNKTRMEVAKIAGDLFVDQVLNTSGNRVGLASYFASSQLDETLTDDNDTLQSTIDGYKVQNPSKAQRYLCENIHDAKDELQSASDDRAKSMVMMTDGNATKCCSKGKCTPDKARQDAIDAACDDYGTTGINIYTIGFGEGADDEMLKEIANCTEAKFRESSNFSGLKDIYEEFGALVGAPSVVYDFQRAEAANLDSELFNDSYIQTNYTPTVEQPRAGEMSVRLQTDQFDGCAPTIDIPSELRVLQSRVTSYSGPHWTKTVQANGNTAYDLTTYSDNFTLLGDPYTIQIPPDYLEKGSNDLTIRTGDNASSNTGCSDNNSMIYRAAINLSSGRTEVKETADGCTWEVDFESGSKLTFSTPTDYDGSDTCYYTSDNITYDAKDSYDVATHAVLQDLDFDNDGEVFVDFSEKDIEIAIDIIEDVPYLWGPAMVEVRLWR